MTDRVTPGLPPRVPSGHVPKKASTATLMTPGQPARGYLLADPLTATQVSLAQVDAPTCRRLEHLA